MVGWSVEWRLAKFLDIVGGGRGMESWLRMRLLCRWRRRVVRLGRGIVMGQAGYVMSCGCGVYRLFPVCIEGGGDAEEGWAL